MWKKCLKIVLLCCLCTILEGGRNVYAAEGELSAKERSERQYDKAIGLAELLRTSPDMLHNKLYTADQEVELQELVDSVCANESTDRAKAWELLNYIYSQMEPGSGKELNGWDTLCDGDSACYDSSGKLLGKKKEAGEMEYCFTFYDVCRLADIPCFILSSGSHYITMVYVEKSFSGAEKDWYFVDVASENMLFTSREDVYENLGDKISQPYKLVLDYDRKLEYHRASIYLTNGYLDERLAPYFAYDSDANKVKAYFPDGTLAAGEQYNFTEAYFGDDGEAPSGWIETKSYSEGKVTIYRSYAVYGVFLRGRVEQDGQEHDLQQPEYFAKRPYYDKNNVITEEESEEHKAFVKDYKKQLENKAIAIAEALLADKNYIWDDTYFKSEEDEKLIREAIETALDWDYIQGQDVSRIAFENAGIPFVPWEEQEPDNIDKAKAQAILLYIKRNVASVDSGAWFVSSVDVLKSKAGLCDGISLLFRDMCVMAGIPCFKTRCALTMGDSDAFSADHAGNLIKVGDEWLFCDPTNTAIIGTGDRVQLSFLEGYETLNKTEIFIDRDAMQKDNIYKWVTAFSTQPQNYYEFDENGKLGIYCRDRRGNPSPNLQTDKNGKYTMENGLYTIDDVEKTLEAEIVIKYAYYYQNLRYVQGKKIIDGTEYDFTSTLSGSSRAVYHKLQELSRKYYISHLTFKPLEEQPYNKDGVCPIPEIYHGDKKLELGKDFRIVEYRNNKTLTTYQDASYKVEGLGDYTGDATRYFKIGVADISKLEVTLSQTSCIWNPYGVRPEVEVPGLERKDYMLEYYDYTKVGKASVVITGVMNSATRKTNATGSVTLEYDILPYPMQEEDIQAEYTETVYNGKVQKPEVTVEGLPKGDYYYKVSYEQMVDGVWQEVEPKEVGEYRIVVQLTDNVELIKEGEKVPNTCYINYTIQADGSGSYPGDSESDSGNTGGETGNGGDSGDSSESGSGSDSGNTGNDIGNSGDSGDSSESGSGSDSGNTGDETGSGGDSGNSSGSGSDSGTGSTGGDIGSSSSSGTGGIGGETGSSSSSGTGSTGGDTGNSSSSGSGGTGNSTSVPEPTDNEKENGIADSDSSELPDSSGTIIDGNDTIGKLKLTRKKGAIKVSWSKVKAAKGYQIQISQYKNYKKAKTVNVKKSKKSYTFKKLKKNKRYYIRIRVYKGKVGIGKDKKKVYGKWKKASQKAK